MKINRRGQAMTEMIFVIPFLVALGAAAMAVTYMCWQGIKVQQAANLAARVQGQERVAGGVNLSMITQDNGVNLGGDVDPTKDTIPMDAARLEALKERNMVAPSPHTVYGKIVKLVRDQFSPSEQAGLFVPIPDYGLVGYSDQVKVVRVWQLPKIFNWQLDPITVKATAYGGEDSHMYGLVRWGHDSVNGTGNLFWSERGNDGKRTNLPNPNND